MIVISLRLIALTVATSLFLGIMAMVFERGIRLQRQAALLRRDITVHVTDHLTKETKTTDLWKRPDGPATLHQCMPFSNRHPMLHATTRFAVVSMLTSDSSRFYTLSAIKLAKSLRWWFPPEKMDLLMMVTDGFGITTNIDSDIFFSFMELEKAGWNIICKVPVIEHPNVVNSNRFHDIKVYSKLNAWALTEYDAILYLDSDTLVIRNPESLFTDHLPAMKHDGMMLGAAIDRPLYWSQGRFNAGVLLLAPTLTNQSLTFTEIVESIVSVPHDVNWAEQGLLNVLYKDKFYVLPFIYNGNLVSKLTETGLWSQYGDAISVVHYTVAKGWMSFSHLSLFSSDHDLWKYLSCWLHNVEEFCQLWDGI